MRALLVAVPGVQTAIVNFDNATALITYDGSKTDVNVLVQAVIVGGYKSWPTDTETTR